MVAVIWASPDMDGLTSHVETQLVKGIQDAGETVCEIHLNKKNILNCHACGKGGYGACQKRGTCVLNDDFESLYDALIHADAFAFVTPVYWHNMAENLKAFLDRLRRCETAHNGFLKGKRALLAACAGGYGLGCCECLAIMENTLSHMGIETADRLVVERFNSSYTVPAAREAGKVFVENYKDFRFDQFDFWS